MEEHPERGGVAGQLIPHLSHDVRVLDKRVTWETVVGDDQKKKGKRKVLFSFSVAKFLSIRFHVGFFHIQD